MNISTNETVVASSEVLGFTLPFTTSPTFDIFIISLFVATLITIINKYFTDQTKIKALRKEMKSMNKNLREEMKKNPENARKMQKEIMQKNMETIKHSFKPKVFLLTAAPLLLVFTFIARYYAQFGQFFDIGFTTFGWLGTYIIFSLINSLIMKKLLKVA